MRKLSVLIVVPILFAFGCASKESKLLGKWQPENKAGAVNTIELKADHKFEQTGAGPASGTWALKDNTITLTVDSAMGKSSTELKALLKTAGMKDDMIAGVLTPSGTLSDDLKTWTLTIMKNQVVLKKVQ